ncbi:S-layer homology domain-containing protein [Bacillus sp. FJAT-28004]|uniref:S-layer homology domain-containing protein n=1 Tax=Bacillus sp. FJAT-28004 TaxID=1679165 RepID=UPI0006B57BE3|nr:S-layer homology domain-containing protein [Bacillus sp. FJAT-28004]
MERNKYFISILLTALLFTSVPVMAGAEALPALVLDASVKYAGDTVKITGTSPYQEVVVKIVKPDGTVLYINVVKVSQGSYAETITLPADAMLGEYTVAAGQGKTDMVSIKSFSVKNKGDSSVTPPTSESNLPPVNVTNTSITTAISSSAMIMTEINDNGVDYSKVSVDKTALSKAFQALHNHSNEASKNLIVSIAVSSNGTTKVELPAEALKEAQDIVPNAIVSIQSSNAGIELPIKAISLTQLESSHNVKASDMMIVVTTQKMPNLFSEKDRNEMKLKGISNLNDPISFNVSVVAGGKSLELEKNGYSNIKKQISISSKIDPRTSTVVAIDPLTHEKRFVPAIFQSTADGGTIVLIKSRNNEIYTIISSSPTFKDTKGHWAQRSIEHLASKQIVNGIGENVFNPSGKVTRAEFISMLVRSLGLQGSSQTSVFQDVHANDWFTGAVQTANELGLINGMSNGNFQPEAQVSREQMAVMIVRSMALMDTGTQATAVDLDSRFKDADHISVWAKEAMALLVSENMLVGVDKDKLAPKNSVTRSEAVTILERFLTFTKMIND